MKFSVSGHIQLDESRPFTKTVEAQSEKHAREQIYAIFGSQNGLRRTLIAIEKITKG